MRIGRVLFIAILLFSGATLLAAASLSQKMINDSLVLNGQAKVMADLKIQQDLKDDYQNKLIACLHDYSSGSLSYQAFQERLLSLRTPSEYKDLHFRLISSFDGLRGNQSSDLARQQLLDLEKNYNWLSSVLSLLISNNF